MPKAEEALKEKELKNIRVVASWHIMESTSRHRGLVTALSMREDIKLTRCSNAHGVPVIPALAT